MNKLYVKSWNLLGTSLLIQYYIRRRQHRNEILKELDHRIEEFKKRFSPESPLSEIKKINQKAGIEAVEIKEDLHKLVKKLYHYSKKSKGKMNLLIDPLIHLHKDQTKSILDKNQGSLILKKQLLLTKYRDLSVHRRHPYVYLKQKGMRLNLTSQLKSYITDQLTDYLVSQGICEIRIRFGKRLQIVGSKFNALYTNELKNKFTASLDNLPEIVTQLTKHKQKRLAITFKGHNPFENKTPTPIICPRTGQLIKSNMMMIAVIAPNSLEAEIWSRILLNEKPRRALETIKKHVNLKGLIVTQKGDTLISDYSAPNMTHFSDIL